MDITRKTAAAAISQAAGDVDYWGSGTSWTVCLILRGGRWDGWRTEEQHSSRAAALARVRDCTAAGALEILGYDTAEDYRARLALDRALERGGRTLDIVINAAREILQQRQAAAA